MIGYNISLGLEPFIPDDIWENNEILVIKGNIKDISSYAQKLVTVWLGGVLKLLDPVLELNPLNDFR